MAASGIDSEQVFGDLIVAAAFDDAAELVGIAARGKCRLFFGNASTQCRFLIGDVFIALVEVIESFLFCGQILIGCVVCGLGRVTGGG